VSSRVSRSRWPQAPCGRSPSGRESTQPRAAHRRAGARSCARNIVGAFTDDRDTPIRFLIRDRDTKFTTAFDEVFQSEHIRIVRSPARAPKANAIAERLLGTLRRECLDRLLIVNRRHLERVLQAYVEHYNHHRPHRALDQRPPIPPRAVPRTPGDPPNVHRRDDLGGLIHEYEIAA
jgi:putative transposase